MSRQDENLEWLKKLQEEQLRSRDPTTKIKAEHQRIAARHKKKTITVRSVIQDMPISLWWTIFGVLIGLFTGIVIYGVTQVSWTQYLIPFLAVAGGLTGRISGLAVEANDDDWG